MASRLDFLVLSCHQRCGEFDVVIIDYTKHLSPSSQMSFNDWGQTRFVDFKDFTDILSSYNATVPFLLLLVALIRNTLE
ncbi:hypothetical protein GGI35DRAFT_249273 [Trichoderma velutinum]